MADYPACAYSEPRGMLASAQRAGGPTLCRSMTPICRPTLRLNEPSTSMTTRRPASASVGAVGAPGTKGCPQSGAQGACAQWRAAEAQRRTDGARGAALPARHIGSRRDVRDRTDQAGNPEQSLRTRSGKCAPASPSTMRWGRRRRRGANVLLASLSSALVKAGANESSAAAQSISGRRRELQLIENCGRLHFHLATLRPR